MPIFETRNMMGLGSRKITVTSDEVKVVRSHPSCHRLAIIEKKNGSCITVQASPAYVRSVLKRHATI